MTFVWRELSAQFVERMTNPEFLVVRFLIRPIMGSLPGPSLFLTPMISNDAPGIIREAQPGSSMASNPDQALPPPPLEQQIFLNQDLVNSIIECFVGDVAGEGLSSDEQWSLRKISALSKTFFDAASNRLWRELSSLLPLFELLPQSSAEEHVCLYFLSLQKSCS